MRPIVVVALLASCVPPASYRQAGSAEPDRSPSAASRSRREIGVRLQNAWNRCLERSYASGLKRTDDKDMAAEMAFRACAAEEDDLTSFDGPDATSLLFPHLKAETKHVLIEEGHLPPIGDGTEH